MSIIGEIEGHDNLSGNSKTTKYEHILPQLAAIEDSREIDGVLIKVSGKLHTLKIKIIPGIYFYVIMHQRRVRLYGIIHNFLHMLFRQRQRILYKLHLLLRFFLLSLGHIVLRW